MAAFNVTVSTNTITISEGDVSLKNTNMPILGGAGGTAQWTNDIFFSIYTRVGGAFLNYSAFSLASFTFTSHDIGMMLAALFPNFYSNANASTLQTDYPEFGPSFARLNGTDITVAPSYNLSTTFDDTAYTISAVTNISNASPWVFTHFGTACGVLEGQIVVNLGASPLSAICLSSIDPTNAAARQQAGIYDEVGSSASTIYVVYTNLFSNAFSNGGMLHPYQFLAIWPIFARIGLTNTPSKKPLAFLDVLMDTFWLRRGESTFFERSLRKNATYGAFGNYLLSVFNYNPEGGAASWDIPVVPIFSSLPEYAAIRKYIFSNVTFRTTATALQFVWNAGYTGSAPSKVLVGNVDAGGFPKVYRRLMMVYCACVEYDIANTSTAGATFISNTESAILTQNPEFATIQDFYQAGATALANGEYAHFFKYASTIPYGGSSNVFATFVAPYISWSANVLALPETLALNKNLAYAQLGILGSSIAYNQVTTIINTNLGIANMDSTEATNCRTYSYTP